GEQIGEGRLAQEMPLARVVGDDVFVADAAVAKEAQPVFGEGQAAEAQRLRRLRRGRHRRARERVMVSARAWFAKASSMTSATSGSTSERVTAMASSPRTTSMVARPS